MKRKRRDGACMVEAAEAVPPSWKLVSGRKLQGRPQSQENDASRFVSMKRIRLLYHTVGEKCKLRCVHRPRMYARLTKRKERGFTSPRVQVSNSSSSQNTCFTLVCGSIAYVKLVINLGCHHENFILRAIQRRCLDRSTAAPTGHVDGEFHGGAMDRRQGRTWRIIRMDTVSAIDRCSSTERYPSRMKALSHLHWQTLRYV